MGKCFDFVIHLFDGSGSKWYYGTGQIVAQKDKIEGYVCDDYLLMERKDDGYTFSFYNWTTGTKYGTELLIDELEFPGKYAIIVSKNEYLSKFVLEVGSQIKDMEKCKQIESTLDRVRQSI